jgi:hypothetical protein
MATTARWAIRVPRRLQEVGLRINAVLPELAQELGRSPTIDEIAVRSEATPEEILDAMEAVQAYSTTSLDTRSAGRGCAGDARARSSRTARVDGGRACSRQLRRASECCTSASSGMTRSRSHARSACPRCT